MTKFNFDLPKEIDKLTRSGTDIIDAIVHIASTYNIDIETIASVVKKDAVLKSKLQIEAENLNIITRTARLPI